MVRSCSNRITESFTMAYLPAFSSMCVGSFALFIFDVIAAQITVGLCRFPTSFCMMSAGLTAAQAQAIADGRLDWMPDSEEELIRELYVKMRCQGLRPRIIVDYIREPFVFGPGNVRVTLDYDIRAGLRCSDFLDPDCPTIPAGDAPMILEVKWDHFLPDVIRDAVQLPGRRVTAFSKYAQCRIYG